MIKQKFNNRKKMMNKLLKNQMKIKVALLHNKKSKLKK
jgi:hypothetical protein